MTSEFGEKSKMPKLRQPNENSSDNSYQYTMISKATHHTIEQMKEGQMMRLIYASV